MAEEGGKSDGSRDEDEKVGAEGSGEERANDVDAIISNMRMPLFMDLAGQLGTGGILGYSVGYAAKEIGRKALYYAGAGIITLQLLAYNKMISVHWGTVFNAIESSLDVDGDGKLTGEDVKVWFTRFLRLVSSGIPGSAGFLAGVYLGLKN